MVIIGSRVMGMTVGSVTVIVAVTPQPGGCPEVVSP